MVKKILQYSLLFLIIFSSLSMLNTTASNIEEKTQQTILSSDSPSNSDNFETYSYESLDSVKTENIAKEKNSFSTTTSLPDNTTTKKWTFMVYISGDNDLEVAAIDDIIEMELGGGSSDDVNVVALIDRCRTNYELGIYDADWSDARYYYIVNDTNTNEIGSILMKELGEINMGDPQTLRNFVHWAKSNFPAEKYALSLWNHGGGLMGVCWDEDNGHDYLNIYELSVALEGEFIDFIGFDACVMGHMEILYELKDHCEVFGASKYNEPFEGWNYENIVRALNENPDMTSAELGDIIAYEYVQYYPYYTDILYSIFNATTLKNDVLPLIETFLYYLILHMEDEYENIFKAREEHYFEYSENKIDMYQFLTILAEYVENNDLLLAIETLVIGLDKMLVSSYNNNYTSYSYGLDVFFPFFPYLIEPGFYVSNTEKFVRGYENLFPYLQWNKDLEWNNAIEKWISLVEEELLIEEELAIHSKMIEPLEFVYYAFDTAKADVEYTILVEMDENVDVVLSAWNEEEYLYYRGFSESVNIGAKGENEYLHFSHNKITRVIIQIINIGESGNIKVRVFERSKLDVTPPRIMSVQHSPKEPIAGEQIEITCTVSDPQSGVESVLIYYSIDGGETFVSTTMTNVNGQSYTGIIQSQDISVLALNYYIVAINTDGFSSNTRVYGISFEEIEKTSNSLILPIIFSLVSLIYMKKRKRKELLP